MLRLQKFLAQSGLGSRRYCEKLIKDRKITINGSIALLGAKVSEDDEVIYEGKRIIFQFSELKVIMLNKPPGVLSSRKREKKIEIVFDFLPNTNDEPEWIAVGRLDVILMDSFKSAIASSTVVSESRSDGKSAPIEDILLCNNCTAAYNTTAWYISDGKLLIVVSL